MEEASFSDWAEEEPRPTLPVTLINLRGTESIPSDWENLADNDMLSEKDITEEDIRLMKELENEMILDGLLTNDDLLGEELMDDDIEMNNGGEESHERTISEQAIPISHLYVVVLTSSQSPTSKRMRSPNGEEKRRSRRMVSDPAGTGSPLSKHNKVEPKKIEGRKSVSKRSIPNIPRASTGASKKLKPFQGKSSP